MTPRKIVPVDESVLQNMIAENKVNNLLMESCKQYESHISTANSKRTKQQSPESSSESDESPKHPDKKNRRTSLEEYRQTFLQVPRIIDRKPVFVSASTREQLDHIVRQLGDRKMSVSGLIENLALNHLKTYQEDTEQWRKL